MPATRARRLAVALGLTLGLAFGGTASALPLADTVVSFSPGDSLFRPGFPGWGVECGNLFGPPYLGDCGPGGVGAGIFDPLAVTALDGASLALGGASGTPGSIVVAFSSFVVTDGLGPDLRVYDGFGLAEGFILDASADGTAFVRVGTFPGTFASCFPSSCATDVDLAGSGLASARYFRITADQATSVVGYPEAYDLDAVEALPSARAGADLARPPRRGPRGRGDRPQAVGSEPLSAVKRASFPPASPPGQTRQPGQASADQPDARGFRRLPDRDGEALCW